MDSRLISRCIFRMVLTEKIVAVFVIVSMLMFLINPVQWDDGAGRHSVRSTDNSAGRSKLSNEENLISHESGGESNSQWKGKVRRFSLFERRTKVTNDPVSEDLSTSRTTSDSNPSYRDMLDGDSFMLLPHGNDTGCYFSERIDQWGLPLVHSVFADQVDRRVVITGVRRPTKDHSWHLEKFQCEFYPPGAVPGNSTELHNNSSLLISVPTDPMIKDEQKIGAAPQGVFIITCRLPRELHGVDVFKMNLRRLADDRPAHTNITVCRSLPKSHSNHFLSMCTMLKAMDKYVPDWLEYHKQMGVERAYIYDNAKYSTLPKAPGVQRHIDSGFLTIIPWAHTYSEGKTYLETQIASENDCLWRHRHDATWMIKTDVDEFLQPMSREMGAWLPNYLNRPFLQNLAGVRLQNWFFCQYDKKLSRSLRRQSGGQGGSVFDRNQYSARLPTPINKGRDKSIVRPNRVHYFKIHAVKWGGDILSFDPYTELRMVHYRGDNPRHPTFCPKVVTKDTSMLELWLKLTNTTTS